MKVAKLLAASKAPRMRCTFSFAIPVRATTSPNAKKRQRSNRLLSAKHRFAALIREMAEAMTRKDTPTNIHGMRTTISRLAQALSAAAPSTSMIPGRMIDSLALLRLNDSGINQSGAKKSSATDPHSTTEELICLISCLGFLYRRGIQHYREN